VTVVLFVLKTTLLTLGISQWSLNNEAKNETISGVVIDPTAGQFSTPVPYDRARGRGFLTKTPSKRAQILIERCQYERQAHSRNC